jgi:predicted MFS family arabinose efflux permease
MTHSTGSPSDLRPLVHLVLARSSAGVQVGSVAAVAPIMSVELGLSGAELGALAGIYTAMTLLISIPGAVWARRFGDKRMVLLSFALMTAGGLLLALAPNLQLALAGRLIAGCGGVMVQMLLSRMVADRYVGGPYGSSAVGTILASWPAGIAVALLVLGPLAQVAGWRASLLVAALAPAIFIVWRPWAEAAAPVQQGHARPLFDYTPREWRAVIILSLGYLCFNGALACYVAFVPVMMSQSGASAANAALQAAVAMGVLAVFTPFGGVIADRIGQPVVVMVGASIGAALAMLGTVLMSSPLMALALAGAMFALAPGPMGAALTSAVRPQGRPAGFALFAVFANVGIMLAPPLAGWLSDVGGSASWAILFSAALIAANAPLVLLARAQPSSGAADHERNS